VTRNFNKRQAQVCYDGKKHNLGSFNTKQEAAAAYDTAVRELQGADAVCNYASAEEGAAAAALASAEWEQAHPAKAKAKAKAAPRPPPKSGFYGVRASGKKWQAYVCCDGKTLTIGNFNTKQEAAAAYDAAARKFKGPGAVCNFASAEEGAAAAALAASEWARIELQQTTNPSSNSISNERISGQATAQGPAAPPA
jgi:hypothetical protein